MIIRRVGVLSVAKITGIIAAVVGLFIGVLVFLAGSVAGGAAAMGDDASAQGLAMFAGMGALAIVLMPIIYGVMGFIGGAIQAFVYNIAARFVGGIRIDTE